MSKTIRRLTHWNDLTIASIIEIGSCAFFTCTMLVSAYLISSQSYRHGFFMLALTSIYFIAYHFLNEKLLKAIIWVAIFGFSLKGFMGI